MNFNTSAPGQPGNGAQNVQAIQQQPQAAIAPPPPMTQTDPMPTAAFSDIREDVGFSSHHRINAFANRYSSQGSMFGDFVGEAGNDTLLDNFDFDSFLHNPDDGSSASIFDPNSFSFPDTVEAGAGES